jgi:hypothetical protein
VSEKFVLMPPELFDEVAAYLMRRPWAEVQLLVPKLQGLRISEVVNGDAPAATEKPKTTARKR